MFVIETYKLRKEFRTRGKDRKARTVEGVKGIDLKVREGEIFGFLGPNGAGKTTTLQMLATLIQPTSGRATIGGYDLQKHPGEVRKMIGYVSQVGGTDVTATARENLMLQAQLFGMGRKEAEYRVHELIASLEMGSFAERVARSYSGGQRRRLDLALGMVHWPRLLFLDEPTTGLDPQSRARLWDEVRKLQREGTTVFLTTHYLEEADALAGMVSTLTVPLLLLSGVLLPMSLAPDLLQTLARLNPFTHAVDAARALATGQFGDAAILRGFVIFAALAALALVWAVRVFRRSTA